MVENAGDNDGTLRYFWDGQKIIETPDGSGSVLQQFIHGTQYIDELVMLRLVDECSASCERCCEARVTRVCGGALGA